MKISIALCTYNGEKYLEEQLRSLLNQTRFPDEIVISDDGSKDSTLSIIERMQSETDIPLRIHKHDENLGVFKNFPFAISACSGDIVFTCDQDDYWLPEKLEKHMEIHERYPETELVYSNADVVFNTLDHYLYPLWEPKTIQDTERGQASQKSLVYKGRSIAGCCMSFKKGFFEKILPIPEGVYHDDWIATSASLAGHIIGIPESLIKYRQHGNNVVGIIRGRKLSFYKSLFTNVKFYFESDRYIFQRHQKVYMAMLDHPYLSQFVNKQDFMDNLKLYEHRSGYLDRSILASMALLSNDLFEGRYRFLNRPFTFIKDLYNIVFMKLSNSRK